MKVDDDPLLRQTWAADAQKTESGVGSGGVCAIAQISRGRRPVAKVLVDVGDKVARLFVLADQILGKPVYLQKAASPDPSGLSRLSVGTSAHTVQNIQHLPAIPKLTKVHVFSIKFG